MKCRLNCFECPYPDCIANGDRRLSTMYSEMGEVQAQRIRDRKHEGYMKAKKLGLCTNCKTRKAVDGIYCLECRDKKRKSYAEGKAKRVMYEEQGLCLKCGDKRIEGSNYCYKHTRAMERMKRNRKGLS